MGAIDYAEGKTIVRRIKNVAGQTFLDEDGNPRQFTWRTISTWYYRYKSKGVTGLDLKPRSDKGLTRKMSPEELLEAINLVLPAFRNTGYNKMEIYKACIRKGIISKDRLAQTTFYRFIREYDLLADKNPEAANKRLAFSMQYANQLWQADTMYGPHVTAPSGRKEQAKLIAFIDDASRIICHGEFFTSENTDNLIAAFRSAIYKRGIPEQLYCDNGSIYSSLELKLVCDRIGCILRFTPVRDAAAKGKIERFFRTVRMKFLVKILDTSSISTFNKQFNTWVEDEYNSRPHSGLGMKPVDRFQIDLKRIRFLNPQEENDELFYAEDTRTVKNDNTFPFRKIRYEAPCDLRGKKITIRFKRTGATRVVVYYKNSRMGPAEPLDLIANARLRKTNKGGPS